MAAKLKDQLDSLVGSAVNVEYSFDDGLFQSRVWFRDRTLTNPDMGEFMVQGYHLSFRFAAGMVRHIQYYHDGSVDILMK